MKTSTKAKITATAGYVPSYILTNEELATMVDTSDEWIRTRTGISERRILKGQDLGTSDLGYNAVNKLLEKTQIPPEEIDLLICATSTPDMQYPATANIICHKSGIKKTPSFDIAAACSGFLFALETASRFIQSGVYSKIIVVGADKMSSIMDYSNRNTCVIFGDGAAAVLLESSTDDTGIIDSQLYTDSIGIKHLHQKAGGSVKPASIDTVQAGEHYVYQEGQKVFAHAVKNMAAASSEIMNRNQLRVEDVDWLVPHQANIRIIDATRARTGIPKEKVMLNIHKYGNTTNATIPLCLSEWESQLKKGDNLILTAFGGGFTWGSIYLKWSY